MSDKTSESDATVTGAEKPSPRNSKTFFQTPEAAVVKSKSKEFFQTPADEETSSSAIFGLIFYSFLLLTAPILVLFLTKKVLEEEFLMDPTHSSIGGAIAAIFTVNVVIVMYVRKAFREESKKSRTKVD